MNNHLRQTLRIISLLCYLFVAGCSSVPGGAAPAVPVLEVEKNSEDTYGTNISSEHSADLQSPAVEEREALHSVPVFGENSGNETELEELVISIKTLKRDQIDKRPSINDYQNAVVTILTAAGHGSGFIITEDGYVLTNQHVVGRARFVNIRLVTGREVTGEVIRTDTFGDAALIKLKEGLYPFVLLGNSLLLDIDDEVYAIGAPLDEGSSQTVTKGIVNSFRMEEGLRYIQSDVTVHGGNSGGPLVSLQNGVVGIYVTGHSFLDGNSGAGLNQFIPIEDAITMLHINNKEIVQNIEEIF